MKQTRLAVLCLSTLVAASAQAITIVANPTSNNGGSSGWAIFFDLTAAASPVSMTGLSTANSALANVAFTVEVFVRTGTALGTSLAVGPGSSAAGWTSLGTAPATQGATNSGISLPIDIPDIAVPAGQTVGVAVKFTGAGPRYFNSAYQTFSDANLSLVTGDSRTVPFTPTGSYFAPRCLVGSISYDLGGNSVSGTVTLNNTVVAPTGEPITVTFYNGSTLVDTQNTTLNASGQYTVATSASGILTVKIDSTHFLRKSAGIQTISGAISGVNAMLSNGDVDNSDEVDAADIDAVIAAFGNTGANISADVDNSLEVDAADIDIVISNFGSTSD